MATYATSIDVSSFSTDAKFRAWVTAVHAAMSGAGFVQTSDTGQINPATVTKPVATQTGAGYEIWRFADALQSTAPIYMRLQYNSSSVASGNGVALLLYVGTGSDGAGNITGLNTGYLSPGIYASSTALTNTASPVLACHTAGYGLIQAGGLVQSTNNAGFWVIARTCNTSGTLTGEGVVIYKQSTSGSLLASAQGMSFTTGTVFSSAAPKSGMITVAASMASGSSLPMSKNYASLGYPVPVNGVLSYYGTDVAQGSTFSTANWGATAHTFLAMGTGYVTGMDSSSTAAISGAFLWE